MPTEKQVGVLKGLQSRSRSRRSWAAAIEGKAVWLAGVGDHFQSLAGGSQFRDQHLRIETVQRGLVSLNDQDRTANPTDLFARKLLILGGVVALGIGRNRRGVFGG